MGAGVVGDHEGRPYGEWRGEGKGEGMGSRLRLHGGRLFAGKTYWARECWWAAVGAPMGMGVVVWGVGWGRVFWGGSFVGRSASDEGSCGVVRG